MAMRVPTLDLEALDAVHGGARVVRMFPNGGSIEVLPAPNGQPISLDGQTVVPGNSPLAVPTTTERHDDGSTSQVDRNGIIRSTTESLSRDQASFETTLPGIRSPQEVRNFADQRAQEIMRTDPSINTVDASITHTLSLDENGQEKLNTERSTINPEQPKEDTTPPADTGPPAGDATSDRADSLSAQGSANLDGARRDESLSNGASTATTNDAQAVGGAFGNEGNANAFSGVNQDGQGFGDLSNSGGFEGGFSGLNEGNGNANAFSGVNQDGQGFGDLSNGGGFEGGFSGLNEGDGNANAFSGVNQDGQGFGDLSNGGGFEGGFSGLNEGDGNANAFSGVNQDGQGFGDLSNSGGFEGGFSGLNEGDGNANAFSGVNQDGQGFGDLSNSGGFEGGFSGLNEGGGGGGENVESSAASPEE